MATERMSPGLGTSPIRIACAPPAAPEPVGASTRSASRVAIGRPDLSDSRIGALIGEAISTAEASEACQSSVGASVTAWGCVPDAVDG